MIGRKKVITILVSLIFLTVLFSPVIDAEEPVNQEQKMTLWAPGVTQNNYFTQIQLNSEDLQMITNDLESILAVINNTLSFDSQGGAMITNEEWEEIGNKINDLIETIKSRDENFPNIDTQQLVTNVIEAFLDPLSGFFFRPAPLLSIGIGVTWIPLYGYESFAGLILRPIFTRYVLGFSRVGGLIKSHYKIGSFSVFTVSFAGLFINFGDIGAENIFGPTMYIGTAAFSRI